MSWRFDSVVLTYLKDLWQFRQRKRDFDGTLPAPGWLSLLN
jgi:hypothetical protein